MANSIRNIAIIAHVDHGKTTLVDGILKQTKTFRDNQKEMQQDCILDSNDLERERGITILAKNTAVFYKDVKINIVDTPGHADFGGEVERTIGMADGAILLVDAAEGPLPQTRFVLRKALKQKLKIILLINKIDKKDARPQEIVSEVENLFLELADDEEALNFTTLYAVGRDGKVFAKLPDQYTSETPGDLQPLLDTILAEVPEAVTQVDQPFQMLISTLDYDSYVGRLCIGRVQRGTLNLGDQIALTQDDKIIGTYRVQKLYVNNGIKREDAIQVQSGEIAAIAGIPQLNIGQTVTDPKTPESLPTIEVEDPTLKVTIGPNTSPLSGKEGKYTTSRQIKERLFKELETNLGLKVENDPEGINFIVHGRGELHLAVLIETMRREGFELQISKPQVIYKEIDDKTCEPYEEVTIDVPQDMAGIVSEELGRRKGQMLDMITERNQTRLVYKISSRNLLGIRSVMLTKTRGLALFNTYLLGYEPKGGSSENLRNGALIATQPGEAVTYGLTNAQERGTLFVKPGDKVYGGMVVGLANREMDIEINVCKSKQLTNNRSSGEGVTAGLAPATILSLEQALDFINDDEMIEVTPQNLRLRKIYLTEAERKRHRKDK